MEKAVLVKQAEWWGKARTMGARDKLKRKRRALPSGLRYIGEGPGEEDFNDLSPEDQDLYVTMKYETNWSHDKLMRKIQEEKQPRSLMEPYDYKMGKSFVEAKKEWWKKARTMGAKDKVKRKGRELSVPEQHQLRIALDNIRNPLKAKFLGGPSVEEAHEIVEKLTGKPFQKARTPGAKDKQKRKNRGKVSSSQYEMKQLHYQHNKGLEPSLAHRAAKKYFMDRGYDYPPHWNKEFGGVPSNKPFIFGKDEAKPHNLPFNPSKDKAKLVYKALDKQKEWWVKSDLPCPGGKIRSKGKGRGLGRGKGKGPIGVPAFGKSLNDEWWGKARTKGAKDKQKRKSRGKTLEPIMRTARLPREVMPVKEGKAVGKKGDVLAEALRSKGYQVYQEGQGIIAPKAWRVIRPNGEMFYATKDKHLKAELEGRTRTERDWSKEGSTILGVPEDAKERHEKLTTMGYKPGKSHIVPDA